MTGKVYCPVCDALYCDDHEEPTPEGCPICMQKRITELEKVAKEAVSALIKYTNYSQRISNGY